MNRKFCFFKRVRYTEDMKYIFALIFSCFLTMPLSAADIVVDSVTKVPSGYSLGADGWYTQSTSPDRYAVSTPSSIGNTPWAGVSSNRTGGSGPVFDDKNVFNVDGDNNSSPLSNKNLREGNVDMYTIPRAIAGMIEFLLAIAGTVAIVSLIYHAVQMQINSGITGDRSWVDKAKKGMYGSLIGFVIAILAYFIVTRVVEILYSVT